MIGMWLIKLVIFKKTIVIQKNLKVMTASGLKEKNLNIIFFGINKNDKKNSNLSL